MYSKDLELNSYINCLWNYFKSYYQSINKNVTNQEEKWLLILERSKLKLNKEGIMLLIKDPNNIFKITKYSDCSLNQIQILKLRYFIVIYWLNYLVIIVNNKNSTQLFSFNNFLLDNWYESIDMLISIFESRNEVLILERNNIYENLKELERIRIRYPHLDNIHEQRLEAQLKALRHILNLECSEELRNLSNYLKDLKLNNYENIGIINENKDSLKKNFKDFIELFEHLSEELLSKTTSIHVHIFKIHKNKFDNLANSHLSLKHELNKYVDKIYNPLLLSWATIDNIKILELKINLKNADISKCLIGQVDKLCHLIYKIVNRFNSSIYLNENYCNYFKIQNNVLSTINNLKKIKITNYDIISKLENTHNYSDLKDLDLEFYYQFLTHINTIINSIINEKEININSKKYLSNDNFVDRKKFNVLIKTLNNEYVSKKEFNLKIKKIEDRVTNIEDNKPTYILGTMVISLISLFIWKKMIKFKTRSKSKKNK